LPLDRGETLIMTREHRHRLEAKFPDLLSEFLLDSIDLGIQAIDPLTQLDIHTVDSRRQNSTYTVDFRRQVSIHTIDSRRQISIHTIDSRRQISIHTFDLLIDPIDPR